MSARVRLALALALVVGVLSALGVAAAGFAFWPVASSAPAAAASPPDPAIRPAQSGHAETAARSGDTRSAPPGVPALPPASALPTSPGTIALSPVETTPAKTPEGLTFAISDDAAQRAFPSELAVARHAGIEAARAYLSWAEIAPRRPRDARDPQDPAYDWTQTDEDMARYAASGLAVWIAFWHTPGWANGGAPQNVWANDPADFERFVVAVATRYPLVATFMVWNEPNLRAFALPNTIGAYEPFARAAYRAVKQVRPSAQVIGGNLARYRDGGRDPAVWAAALARDAVPMDAFGIHPYPDFGKPLSGRAPDSRIDLFDVPALARIAGVPVAVTEFGWSSQFAGASAQAIWTAEAIRVARCTPGLAELAFWGFRDHPVRAGETPDPWVRFGWLYADGRPKPVLAAASAAITGALDCASVARTSGAPDGWPATNTIPPAFGSSRADASPTPSGD